MKRFSKLSTDNGNWEDTLIVSWLLRKYDAWRLKQILKICYQESRAKNGQRVYLAILGNNYFMFDSKEKTDINNRTGAKQDIRQLLENIIFYVDRNGAYPQATQGKIPFNISVKPARKKLMNGIK